jgi:hypothetical protein
VRAVASSPLTVEDFDKLSWHKICLFFRSFLSAIPGARMTLLLRSVFGLAAVALPFLFLLLVAIVYS